MIIIYNIDRSYVGEYTHARYRLSRLGKKVLHEKHA